MGTRTLARTCLVALSVAAWLGVAACKPSTVGEAEAKRDVAWLDEDGSAQAIAALARLADSDPRAVTALERRSFDAKTYIAAWDAVTRGAPWGTRVLKTALADPTRADLAARALPRRDPRLVSFVPDLEGAVVRLSAGERGSVVAGALASVGQPARAEVERRLLDPKTRGVMCDGIGLPDASNEAKSQLLAAPPEGRDHASCVDVVLAMATTLDTVLDWLAASAEPGLMTAMAKSSLPCPRVSAMWTKALVERSPESHAAMTVALQLSLRRCAAALDPVTADLLGKAPRARACIVQAIEPFSSGLAEMKRTCDALRAGWVAGEAPRIRERARDAIAHGCALAR